MKKGLFAMFVLLTGHLLQAQTYPESSISPSLKTDADAVVRYQKTEFIQTDMNNASYRYTVVKTILNEDGNDNALIVIPQDRFMEFKNFSGTVQDAETGKTLKKIGRNDLVTTAYSPNMASDDQYSYYQYKSPVYPYTIKYEYEIRLKNGIPSYPFFAPIRSFGVSVEHAEYMITLPKGQKVRYKALNMKNEQPKVTEAANTVSYTWGMDSVPAIREERLSLDIERLAPSVMIAPEEFCMEGQCGNMDSWKNLGKWNYQLLGGRQEILPELKDKLLQLTKDAPSDKEKVKRIFEYLQSSTRYVSIQLGIGGWQPESASKVAKVGFGDCKGLSNYMGAMLEAVGIPSTYVVISTDKKKLYPDFASLTQMNHVILMVPLPQDTLWLECTNQQLPFNYVHSSIAGHQSLLVKESGGEIQTVKTLPAVVQEQKSIYIQLDNTGMAKGNALFIYRRKGYEEKLGFAHNQSREEQINSLAKELSMSKINILSLDCKEHKSEDPELCIQLNLVADNFANKTGGRLFVPLSPMDVGSMNLIKGGKRLHEISFPSAYSELDSMHISIPDTHVLESMPKSISLKSDFGEYTSLVSFENQILKVVQSLSLKEGVSPASKAQEFQDFLNNVDRESRKKAVFRQKE